MKPELAGANEYRPTVVGTGLVAVDALVDVRQPKVGPLYAGGTCGNVLTILSALGWNSRPVTRLGLDLAGKIIQDDMESWGLDLSLVVKDPTSRSPVYFHWLRRGESGQPAHRFSRDCPECGTPLPGFRPVPLAMIETLVETLHSVDVLFADRVSRGALRLGKLCRDRGALVVFEPSGLGDPSLFSEMLATSHIVKYSNERGKKIASLLSEEQDLSCLVIETLGSMGLRFQVARGRLDRDSWTVLPPVAAVEVRDTGGAGDWCTAGLLHSIGHQGLEGFCELTPGALEQSLMRSQQIAAWSCAFEGARGGMYVSEEWGGIKEELRRSNGSSGPGNLNHSRWAFTCRAASELCATCASSN
jgi:sugar/nucleoside kinase (ribokinase family)